MKRKFSEKERFSATSAVADKDGDISFDMTNAACATECTGLIQVPPESEDELENYNDVYSFTKE